MTNALNLLGWNLLIVLPLALAVWLLCRTRLLRERPALCHVAWLLVLLKLVTPPLVPIRVNLIPVMPTGVSHVSTVTTETVAASGFSDDADSLQHLSAPSEAVPKISSPASKSAAATLSVSLDVDSSLPSPEAEVRAPRFSWQSTLVVAMGLSLTVSLGVWIRAYQQYRRIRRFFKPREMEPRRASMLLRDVAVRFELSSLPRLYVLDAQISPMLWAEPGRSAIILPRRLTDAFDEQALRAILAHELAHFVRRDQWTSLFAFFVTTLFWWHPVAWLARREMLAAAEASCDALALERIGIARKSYAETLVTVVDFVTLQKGMRSAFGLGYGGSHSLRRRVELLATMSATPRLSRPGLLLLALGLVPFLLFPARAQDISKSANSSSQPGPTGHGTGVNGHSDRFELAKAGRIWADVVYWRKKGKPKAVEIYCKKIIKSYPNSPYSELAREQLADRPSPNRNAPPRERRIAVSPNAASEKPPAMYYATGRIFDKETKQPIAGAKIQILVESEPDPQKRLLKGISGADGRYRIEVPMGSCRLWFSELKPGYWLKDAEAGVGLATSPEKPVATHDIAARSGPVWPIQLSMEGASADWKDAMVSVWEIKNDKVRQALFRGEPVSFYDPLNQSFGRINADGSGVFTQSGESGKLVVNVGDRKRRAQGLRAEFLIDPSFDQKTIQSVTPIAGADKVQMTDASGAKAVISKATVTLQNGKPLLTFRLAPAPPIPMQTFSGRVVDGSGRSVEGVRIGAAVGAAGGGSAAVPNEANSDREGRFQITIPIYSEGPRRTRVNLILNKQGYAAADSQNIDLPKNSPKKMDVGKLTLYRGYSLPIRITNAKGRPLPGAIVEPSGDYALRRLSIRSDSEGRGILRDLPAGMVSVSVRYGEFATWTKLVVSASAAENSETTIQLKAAAPLVPPSAPLPPSLKIGAAAPEWSLTGWTDGRERRLADYRGKFVVLEFWGTWCGPCVRSIPMMQALASKYEPRGVVFLGIHTPTDSMEQIIKLKRFKSWQTPSGVDRGTSFNDGETNRRYAIRGYPSLIIIDGAGKVAFNSTPDENDQKASLDKLKAFAKSANLAWPSDDNKDEAKAENQANALLTAFLSDQIDKLLARSGR